MLFRSSQGKIDEGVGRLDGFDRFRTDIQHQGLAARYRASHCNESLQKQVSPVKRASEGGDCPGNSEQFSSSPGSPVEGTNDIQERQFFYVEQSKPVSPAGEDHITVDKPGASFPVCVNLALEKPLVQAGIRIDVDGIKVDITRVKVRQENESN